MQAELNRDGSINTAYRPPIFAEKLTYNTVLYNPFQAPIIGLYKDNRQYYETWKAQSAQYFQRVAAGNGNPGGMYQPPRQQGPLPEYGGGVTSTSRQGTYRLLYST